MSGTTVRMMTALLFLSVLCSPRVVHAQRRGNASRIQGKGKIEAIKPGFLKVSVDGSAWVMKVAAKPRDIALEGTADKNWLQPGMLVRFVAPLDEQGVAQTPIEELSVFTPRPGYRIGVLPENRADVKAGFDGDTQPTGSSYLVAGQLAKKKDDQILVSAGRDRVTATLADELKINVDMLGDYSLARPGDEIVFSGRVLKPGQAIIDRIRIVAAQPFETAQRLPDEKAARRNSAASKNDKIDAIEDFAPTTANDDDGSR